MTPTFPMLVGDGVENPMNAATLSHLASRFGWGVGFWDRNDLARGLAAVEAEASPTWLEPGDLHQAAIVVVENGPGAVPVYGYRSPALDHLVLVVGNERTGVSGTLCRAAATVVEIPMVSRSVRCLNVAAAAAVVLYYVARGGGGAMRVRSEPNRHRPELVVMAGGDHVELGSSLRSAAAFGWRRAFVEDRAGVWFEGDRRHKTEARAAARRAKNAIKLVPTPADRHYAFDEAVVVTTRPGSAPLGRVNLAAGPRQVLVLADEGAIDLHAEALDRFAGRVRFASLELPPGRDDEPYHFRLFASMALAEATRQIGRPSAPGRRGRRPPVYDRRLQLDHDEVGEWWSLAELLRY